MCSDCPNNVLDLAADIREYLRDNDWVIVGGLHIVIEDENVADDHIEWCLANEKLDEKSREFADKLLEMPVPSRHMTIQIAWERTD